DAVNVGALAGATKSQVTSIFITKRSQTAPVGGSLGLVRSLRVKTAWVALRGFGSVRCDRFPRPAL
ncbi:MAG: hypothetical protein QOF47_3185, partial [Mycobacterium sp.]|nr:hypothetical protein [Mycobacterium sp.]